LDNLHQLSRSEFASKLKNVLKPAKPIDSIELLFGREKEIEDIEYALPADGRHCFIYGERGIGKSSLAHVVASQLQSSDKRHLRAECHKGSTFTSVINSLVNYANKNLPKGTTESQTKTNVKFPVLSHERTTKNKSENNRQYGEVVDEALDLFREIAASYSDNTVAVIDEFDAINDDAELAKFGELLKYLSDLDINVTLIFTGIGKSLSDLLGGHFSSVRQLHQVPLEPLNWSGRYSIIEKAFNFFDIAISDDFKYKIAGLSDGFPHYVHLLCEKILVEVHKCDNQPKAISHDLFLLGLDAAINSVGEQIKKDYDKATEGRSESFHHLLWAAADSADLIRQVEHVQFSYVNICKVLDLEPLNQDDFKKCLQRLRDKSSNNILTKGLGSRPGWIKFKESILRGFIRMYAERHGATLDFERNFTAQTASSKTHKSQRLYRPLTNVEQQVSKLRREK